MPVHMHVHVCMPPCTCARVHVHACNAHTPTPAGWIEDQEYDATMIVTPLGREKRQAEPMWTQDDTKYRLTKAGKAVGRGWAAEAATGALLAADKDIIRAARAVADAEAEKDVAEEALADVKAADVKAADVKAADLKAADVKAADVKAAKGEALKSWCTLRGMVLRALLGGASSQADVAARCEVSGKGPNSRTRTNPPFCRSSFGKARLLPLLLWQSPHVCASLAGAVY